MVDDSMSDTDTIVINGVRREEKERMSEAVVEHTKNRGKSDWVNNFMKKFMERV